MMWDFSGGKNSSNQRPAQSKPQSPPFPVPQHFSSPSNGSYNASYPSPHSGASYGTSYPFPSSGFAQSINNYVVVPAPHARERWHSSVATPAPEIRARRHSTLEVPTPDANKERQASTQPRQRNKLRKPQSQAQIQSNPSLPRIQIQIRSTKPSDSKFVRFESPAPKPATPKIAYLKPSKAVQPSSSHQRRPHHGHSKETSGSSTFSYSKCTGRKRALCIGINYSGQKGELRGCINDARHVRKFLVDRHGFDKRDVMLLADDLTDPRRKPTKKNILDAMYWLVRSASQNDSLFFHFSGHGGQIPDLDGDEVDGWDETIFPLDHDTHGVIVDDDMNRIMVQSLPEGCRLTALFDSCHSGTILDLPYIYSPKGRLEGQHVSPRALKEKSTPADVISWSACMDNQKSTDTFAAGVAVGAMSHAFISSLDQNPNQSYQDLLKSVR